MIRLDDYGMLEAFRTKISNCPPATALPSQNNGQHMLAFTGLSLLRRAVARQAGAAARCIVSLAVQQYSELRATYSCIIATMDSSDSDDEYRIKLAQRASLLIAYIFPPREGGNIMR
jgi:hypothetical protein